METLDPLFRSAVSAIDTGDADGLKRLLAEHPALVRQRADYGEGYFRQPYLLWFVAENPIRNDKLPANITQMTRLVIEAAERERVDTLQAQLDYALALVCSGRVARKCGRQRELIDTLMDAGADPKDALLPAIAHRETDAVTRLLERGAALTLPAAISVGRDDELVRLGQAADPDELRLAFAAAALYGQARTLEFLIGLGVDIDACNPPGLHSHATALHQAVNVGSLAAVRTLVEAGARLDIKDTLFGGTPLGWAEHLGRAEIAAYLRGLRQADKP